MIYGFILFMDSAMCVDIDLHHHASKIKTRVNVLQLLRYASDVTHSMVEFIKYSISRSQNKTAEIN